MSYDFPPPVDPTPAAIIAPKPKPWGNVFPAGTGLLLEKNDMAGFSYEIKVTSNRRSVDVRALPDLSVWTATRGEKTGFELSILANQELGLAMLLDNIQAQITHWEEAKPEWREQVEKISDALSTFGSMANDLAGSIGTALANGKLQRTASRSEEEFMKKHEAFENSFSP